MSDTQTPPEVAAAAAVPDAIDLSDLTLIGIFAGPETARALLRWPDGEIQEVRPGDDTRAGQIVAVGEDFVALSRRGTETVLRLPGS